MMIKDPLQTYFKTTTNMLLGILSWVSCSFYAQGFNCRVKILEITFTPAPFKVKYSSEATMMGTLNVVFSTLFYNCDTSIPSSAFVFLKNCLTYK